MSIATDFAPCLPPVAGPEADVPKRYTYTDDELEALDKADAARNTYQRRLLAIETKLEAAGLNLDDLIELIKARQEGRY